MIISAVIKAMTFYFLYVAIKNIIKMFQLKQQVNNSTRTSQSKGGAWNYTGQSKSSQKNDSDVIEAEYRVID